VRKKIKTKADDVILKLYDCLHMSLGSVHALIHFDSLLVKRKFKQYIFGGIVDHHCLG
jgi:hypothetical protein